MCVEKDLESEICDVNSSFQSSCSCFSLVEHNFYVDIGMATMTWLMVVKEILAAMNKGENTQGKVHYVRTEACTAFWGIMALRVFRLVVGLLITDFSKECKGQGVWLFFLIPQKGLL